MWSIASAMPAWAQQPISWVAKGPNEPITPDHTENALGPDLIDMLTKQTGLSRQELLSRLSKVLPEAVDKLTPDGRLPAG